MRDASTFSCKAHDLHHLRHGHGAFCSNWHNGTGTHTSHLSHEKSTNQASANKTFTSKTIDPAINRSKPLKLQRTSKSATTTARRLIRMPKPPQKLAILARNYRFSTKTPDSPVKNTNEQ